MVHDGTYSGHGCLPLTTNLFYKADDSDAAGQDSDGYRVSPGSEKVVRAVQNPGIVYPSSFISRIMKKAKSYFPLPASWASEVSLTRRFSNLLGELPSRARGG